MNIINNKKFLLSQKDKIIDKYVYITTSDLAGKIIDISTAYLELTGYKREEIIGQNHSIFRNQDLDKSVIQDLWKTLHKNEIWTGEFKNNKVTGEEYWVKAFIEPLYDDQDIKIGYTAVNEDITSKKKLEELSIKDPLTLLSNRRYFDTFFKRELNRTNWKKEYFALLLLSVDYYEDYKDTHGRLLADKAILQIADGLKICLENKIYEIFKVTELEFAIILIDYDDSYIENLSKKLLNCVESLKIINEKSQVSDFFTLSIGAVNIHTQDKNLYCNDIYNLADSNLSKAKKNGRNSVVLDMHDDEITNLKNMDHVTKLPNRNTLVHDINLLDEEAMLIILHIRQVNMLKNLYGFDFTVSMISNKTQQLQNIIRDAEVSLYSLNLKEFAILIPNPLLFEKYLLLIQHSILMDNTYHVNTLNEDISADFTAGIAYGLSNLFNHADLVLQEAILSKIQYKVYKNNQSSLQLEEETLKRLMIYKRALNEGNITPYLQPIVDTKTAKILKYEALARIETDDGEVISPYYFLDSAKEDKSFEYFSRQMMQKVFNIFEKNSIDISMNLTYENITSTSMVEYIRNRLEKYGGKGMTFEILESEDIADYDLLKEFITMVKSYGCQVSIDDFGSGYSNFAHILQLKIDYIKIDGSIIQKLTYDENIQHMLKGMLSYAKSANIKTIAEFVSSKELNDIVHELGIDYIQGYYYGEPKPPHEYGLLE
ncbi:EAL domain-containing protein [Sulfurimonas sp. SAG-AH-194-C21]|nr:EAL domain-containing protein [Sulfurimonas sp. SAG-AH-194-C21]MDF1882810.1 EAL domain-containing protein [Sulfurimonas sp. SAG-AH-194-C21]